MTIQIKAAIIAFWTAIAVFGGWHGHAIYSDHLEARELAKEQAQHQLDLQRDHDNAVKLESDLKNERIKTQTLMQKVEDENAKIIDNCIVPDPVIRLRNEAIQP